MLSVIAICLFLILLGVIVCLYEIRLIQIKLKGLFNEKDAREMVVEYNLLLDDRLTKFNSDLQNQIDQIKQQKKIADQDKWDNYRKAFTPPAAPARFNG